jgi:hypothetical protein
MKDYDNALRFAKKLDALCNLPADPGLERIKTLREQLLMLFLRFQRGELTSADARTQSILIQEELARLLWSLDDWQVQVTSRN